METKICKKCGQEKSLDQFNKQKRTKDGLRTWCRTCFSKVVAEWASKDLVKRRASRNKDMKVHRQNFPEKFKARNKAKKIKAPEGMIKHHWSYNEEHWLDLFFFTHLDHMKIHRYMIYDQEHMMYRTVAGELLDTREKHEAYLQTLKDKE